MELHDEFEEAVRDLDFIDFNVLYDDSMELNVFETTIRHLGGLLSAYDLSHGKYPGLLHKAVHLGHVLYHAFDTPNRNPLTRWKPSDTLEGVAIEADDVALVTEIGSLTLEFTRLSQLTGNPKWFDAVQRVTNFLEGQQNLTALPGLWPVTVDAREGDLTVDRTFSIGGMADSVYEYLPKVRCFQLREQGVRVRSNPRLTALFRCTCSFVAAPLNISVCIKPPSRP